MREQFGKIHAGLAVAREFVFRAEQRGIGLDEGGAVILQQFGGRELAVALREFRLGIEELEVARRAGLEKVNDAFGLRREMWRAWSKTVRRRRSRARLPRE